MKKASQFLPRGPYPLSSEQWVADYNLTRLFGDANSTIRTLGQTEIGLFWADNPIQQFGRTFNSLVRNYQLDVMDSARLMAVVWTGLADSLIGCFNAKYTFWPLAPRNRHSGRWRKPRAYGGFWMDTTSRDAEPPGIPQPHMAAEPVPYQAWSLTSSALRKYMWSWIAWHSLMVFTPIRSRTPPTGSTGAFWARIYSGFHFHHSLQDGVELGRRVSRQLFENNFQCNRERRRDDSVPANR